MVADLETIMDAIMETIYLLQYGCRSENHYGCHMETIICSNMVADL